MEASQSKHEFIMFILDGLRSNFYLYIHSLHSFQAFNEETNMQLCSRLPIWKALGKLIVPARNTMFRSGPAMRGHSPPAARVGSIQDQQWLEPSFLSKWFRPLGFVCFVHNSGHSMVWGSVVLVHRYASISVLMCVPLMQQTSQENSRDLQGVNALGTRVIVDMDVEVLSRTLTFRFLRGGGKKKCGKLEARCSKSCAYIHLEKLQVIFKTTAFHRVSPGTLPSPSLGRSLWSAFGWRQTLVIARKMPCGLGSFTLDRAKKKLGKPPEAWFWLRISNDWEIWSLVKKW